MEPRHVSNDLIALKHLRWLKRGIRFDQNNPQSYASIAVIHFYYCNDPMQALAWASHSLKAQPYVPDMTDAIALIRRIQIIDNKKISSFFRNLEKMKMPFFEYL